MMARKSDGVTYFDTRTDEHVQKFGKVYDDFIIDSVANSYTPLLESLGHRALDNPELRWQYQKYIWLTPVRLIRRLYQAWRGRR